MAEKQEESKKGGIFQLLTTDPRVPEDEKRFETLTRKWLDIEYKCDGWNKWFMTKEQKGECYNANVDAIMETYRYFKNSVAVNVTNDKK
jgi:hypothetical protein